MPSTVSLCRSCDSSGHHLSHLRPFDWPLYAFGFIPIRCKNCGKRSYRHKRQSESLAGEADTVRDDRLN